MKANGYNNVGVYANPDYFRNVLDYNEIQRNGLVWLAHWGVSAPAYDCNVWQYSSSGSVSGITGNVDMNYLINWK